MEIAAGFSMGALVAALIGRITRRRALAKLAKRSSSQRRRRAA